jgi:hypothetical protein
MVLSNLTCQFSKKSEKMAYNFNEYVDMLLYLGASNDNASEATRDYAILYSQRRHPDAKVIRRLMQRLRENGQIMPLYVKRGRPVKFEHQLCRKLFWKQLKMRQDEVYEDWRESFT